MKKRTEQKHRKQQSQPSTPQENKSLKPAGPDIGPESVDASLGIPVVGIGGSAGALEPFKTFLTSLPDDSGAAFVIIQHLAPTHESLLPELLAQHTRMRVVQARDAVPVEPNSVYVIPPNEYLAIRSGVLHLVDVVKETGIRMPIDFFFRSLAEDQRGRAICILFSGASSDGTLGVRAVRGEGGLAMVQDPKTAQFNDMPRSAIATGMVDFVLPPEGMAETLLTYLRHPYVRGGEPEAVLEGKGKRGALQDILTTMLKQTGSDFRYYKKSTVLRRIERRMGLHLISDVGRYYDLLRSDSNEVTQLYKDLLINVTSFFRDGDAFEELRQKVIAQLVRAKQADELLRVWVAGCASGEEAYSIGMLIIEEIAMTSKNCQLQIFATDVDEEALEFARQGVYPASIAADLGPERLSRFFVRKEHGYQVGESLRESVVFALQNLITDPPFSKMDLISCRNLLIYLDNDTQQKIIPLFNFALNSGGYLFLGKAEGIGGQSDLFDVVSKKARLFRRLNPARPIAIDSPILPRRMRMQPPIVQTAIKPSVTHFADLSRQALLNHFAASLVLVDRKGQILQFYGQTGKYLNMPIAEPKLNLLDVAKEGLSMRLRAALHNAFQDSKTVTLESVPVTRDDGGPFVRVAIVPTSQRSDAEPLLAVIFEDVSRPPNPAVSEQAENCESETVVKELEDELRATQQELNTTVQELQASNEELRVSNEEVVSTNEELQSTVEELETSKEELQSVNEELTIVNSQLQDKVEKLDAANSDLSNLLKSTDLATLFLDREMRIKLFTPATTQVLKLIPSDVGRPLSDMSLNFGDYDLLVDAEAVARGGDVIEREVQHADGSHYLVRVMPYRNKKDRIEGTVATFSDITGLRRAEKQILQLATAVKDSNDAVLLFDPTGKILTWNRGAHNMYGWSEAEALPMNIRDITPPGKTAELVDLILRLVAGETIASFETQRLTKDGRILDIWLTATALRDKDKKTTVAIATTERDITGRKKAEKELRESEEKFRATYEQAAVGIEQSDLQGRFITGNGKLSDILGYSEEELRHLTFMQITQHEDLRIETPLLEQLIAGQIPNYSLEKRYIHKDGHSIWVRVTSSIAKIENPYRISIIEDITERKKAEEELLNLTEELRRSNAELEQFAYAASHDMREPLRTITGFLKLLERRYKGKLDEKADEYISFTIDSVTRMDMVLKDLLEFSRLGAKAHHMKPLNCSVALEQALYNLRSTIEESGAEITYDLLPTVMANESQIASLFQNLLSNSIKFRGKGKLRIHVSAEQKDNQWVFSVQDNGIGIDPKFFDRIFVIFRRLHTRQEYEGTGIGLAICKKIVELHGGRIWVESESGEGATFYFTLPVLDIPPKH